MADEPPEAAARKRIKEALDLIDRSHAQVCPRCRLCGQLTAGLDTFGLCSRISVTHAEWRGAAPQKGNRR